ncbi:MAG TPA: carboxypeptidase-like regulatory domain-containing protein, partial [Tangfeifania sp.]|nr:carboxypeptidase-like regulatory domain-containing protein [Tangfeifania sp.]
MRKFLLLSVMLIVCASYTMAQKTVTGTVSSSDGSVMPGVTVVVKGTTIGTVTNSEGEYSVGVPEENDILVFSFIGMKTTEVSVGNNTKVDVTLEEDVVGLEEVIAIGYGTQRKGSVTGSISSVDSEDIQELPVLDA